MAFDLDALRSGLPTMVPMVGTLELEFLELDPHRAVVRLPDSAAYRNHIGGPHVGAMFTLAESASASVVLANFADLLGEVTPLMVEATIRCTKVAMGEVTATATSDVAIADVMATLGRGERPEFVIDVELSTGSDDDRVVTGIMTVLWTLRPQRR